MTVLHTVCRSPFERSSFASCLDHALPGATVLLIEDAVYAALRGSAPARRIERALAGVRVCALGPDLEARGVAADRLVAGVEVVDYEGFVDLVAGHHCVNAWL